MPQEVIVPLSLSDSLMEIRTIVSECRGAFFFIVSLLTFYCTCILLNTALPVGGAFDRKNRRRVSSVFSSDSARKKWREMEKKVSIVHIEIPP